MAEADDRDERRVRALARNLRTAIDQGASEHRLAGLTRAALGIDEPDDDVADEAKADPTDGPAEA